MANHNRFNRRQWNRFVAATMTGGLFIASCTASDLRNNLVAGTLAYVKNTSTSFWNSFIPSGEVFDSVFNRGE